MKRRNFLKNLGIGISPIILNSNISIEGSKPNIPSYNYPKPKTLQEAANIDGHLMVRLEFNSSSKITDEVMASVKIKKGKINRAKSYFFENGEDELDSRDQYFSMHLSNSDYDIVVLWFEEFSDETEILLNQNDNLLRIKLQDLIIHPEMNYLFDNIMLRLNILLDKEIGALELADLGIKENNKNFTFTMFADPQGGDVSNPDDERTRMKIHNAFIEESVKLANNLKTKPAFAMVIGDIVDGQGETRDFLQMNKFLSKINTPVLYELGNHETRYKLNFGPGYNMSGFANYFAAQKAFNGVDKLLYSFNLGEWHFIVWPDPLRAMFWENHPHYFDWLERDLEKNKDRPTIVFQHVPVHPIGINPLINYSESVFVKRTLIKLLSKHRNVKYVFSGHVHIPVKSSFKTAVSFKGIKFINLPAAGYRPRAFGENDYYGRPSQGIGIVDIKGKEAIVTYKTVTKEEYQYPEELPEFNDNKFPLWLGYKWELPANKQFLNGSFESGINGWGRRFVYEEDKDPSNICEVRRVEEKESMQALYLKTKKRGFAAPGQDRLPQDINRIFQSVEIENGQYPYINFSYKLDGKNCDFNGFSGMYVWVEGYTGSVKTLNLIYTAGKAWVNMGNTYGRSTSLKPMFFNLNNAPDKWHKVILNIKNDFEKNKDGVLYDENSPERLVISLGIWNINDGNDQPFASYFDGFKLKYNLDSISFAGSQNIDLKNDNMKWWVGKQMKRTNLAGEHHYHIEGLNKLKY